MSNYVFSPNAQQSLRHIKAYSLETFGDRQTQIYLELIETKLQALADNPEQGRTREELKRSYLSFPAGSHVIFYRKAQGYIEIIDILHQRMEPHFHLGDEE